MRQVREGVRFADAVRELDTAGVTDLIELGPDGTLTALAGGILAESATAVATLHREHPEADTLLTALARVYVRGHAVDWAALFGPARPPRVELPTYPFQRTRYWLDASRSPEHAAGVQAAPDGAFWELVAGQDSGRLAEAIGVTGEQLEPVLPALAAWSDRRRSATAADSWRHRVLWRSVPVPATGRLTGDWLVAAPPGVTGHPWVEGLSRALVARGARPVLLEAGPHRSELAARIRALGSPAGVVSLLGLGEGSHPEFPAVPWTHAANLALTQALEDAGAAVPLWYVSRGAVSTGPSDPVTEPAQALVWGFAAILAVESPAQYGGLLDLPSEADDRLWEQAAALLADPSEQREGELALRPAGVFARRLVPAVPLAAGASEGWRPSGTTLITGGTGALGGHVARWLAGRGAEHLLLVSRRGVEAPGAAVLAAELAALGTSVSFAAADVADREELAAVLASVPADRPLTAVVHTAAALHDGLIAGLTAEQLDLALRAKVRAAQLLHELTLDQNLTAFVLFSSLAGLRGIPGQANYAPGNAYLDALADQRRAAGLPATAIAWGHWAGAGLAAEGAERQLLRHGLVSLPPEQAVTLLGDALDRGESHLVVADADWSLLFGDRFHPLAAELVRRSDSGSEGRAGAAEPDGLVRRLAGHPPGERGPALLRVIPAPAGLVRRLPGPPAGERRRALLGVIRAQAAAVQRRASAEAIDPDRAFRLQGFDSLTAVEFRNRLSTALDHRLPATLVFDYPTPAALADWLGQELWDTETAEALPAPAVHAAEDDPVVIVGMACRFPGGVESPDDLWRLVSEEVDALTEFPTDRGWDLEALYSPDPDRTGTSYSRHGGFLDGVGDFDAEFFGIPPREAPAVDPQQRLLLETTWQLLERAGIDPTALRGSRTGVFAGISGRDYAGAGQQVPAELEAYLGIGNAGSVASGRISYTFGFEGPAVTVD
ncbi:SDR family NAD(P)-dependent oxidoreductase, partial [Kitasatospora nipponensis]|uniref:SDR family NAD(P)-dependent oxidoreductase n=1 Tax=Kitasatospora nipponensis TaxID=258049 RepID=UPI0031DC10A8